MTEVATAQAPTELQVMTREPRASTTTVLDRPAVTTGRTTELLMLTPNEETILNSLIQSSPKIVSLEEFTSIWPTVVENPNPLYLAVSRMKVKNPCLAAKIHPVTNSNAHTRGYYYVEGSSDASLFEMAEMVHVVANLSRHEMALLAAVITSANRTNSNEFVEQTLTHMDIFRILNEIDGNHLVADNLNLLIEKNRIELIISRFKRKIRSSRLVEIITLRRIGYRFRLSNKLLNLMEEIHAV
ncbi:MAG: helix-turn-helix domain-containing protein [Patescibacteria group bacterium]